MSRSRDLTPEERRLWRQEMGHEPKEPATKTPAAVATKKPVAKKSPPPALPVETGKQATRILKPHGRPQATLDLHEVGKVEAYGLVQAFLARSQASGKRHVIIITGKGRTSAGVLRENLPHWLNEPALRSLVGGITHAAPDKGGSGCSMCY